MSNEIKLLEVGDEIVAHQYSSYGTIYKVTRVTAKRAFCKVNVNYEKDFHREYGTWIKAVGRDEWGPSFHIIDDKTRTAINKQLVMEKCSALMSRARVSRISEDDQKAIIEILSKYETA